MLPQKKSLKPSSIHDEKQKNHFYVRFDFVEIFMFLSGCGGGAIAGIENIQILNALPKGVTTDKQIYNPKGPHKPISYFFEKDKEREHEKFGDKGVYQYYIDCGGATHEQIKKAISLLKKKGLSFEIGRDPDEYLESNKLVIVFKKLLKQVSNPDQLFWKKKSENNQTDEDLRPMEDSIALVVS